MISSLPVGRPSAASMILVTMTGSSKSSFDWSMSSIAAASFSLVLTIFRNIACARASPLAAAAASDLKTACAIGMVVSSPLSFTLIGDRPPPASAISAFRLAHVACSSHPWACPPDCRIVPYGSASLSAGCHNLSPPGPPAMLDHQPLVSPISLSAAGSLFYICSNSQYALCQEPHEAHSRAIAEGTGISLLTRPIAS